MRHIIAGLGLLAVWGALAHAQDSGDGPSTIPDNTPPTAEKCAAVYGAFAQDQANFGASDSLLGERYSNYMRISFDDRLNQLAGKAEKNVSDLKGATDTERAALYMKLVDAETEGEMDAQVVRDMIRLSDSCDDEFGFSPSLGS